MASVNFFAQDISFKLPKPRETKQWILEAIAREQTQLDHLNYIFCSDAYLLSMNERYLNHKTLTDIITFDNSEKKGWIEGDIFISIERVKANAETLSIGFDEELHRVIIHGVLHLIGYSDKSAPKKAQMRKKEDAYLSLRKKL
jgi:probable rRNA maturation factor